MYSKRKESDLRTPFWTLSSGTRYSFIRAGRTVKGEQVSATMAMATVVQTRICRSCTLRLFRRVASTSCGLGGKGGGGGRGRGRGEGKGEGEGKQRGEGGGGRRGGRKWSNGEGRSLRRERHWRGGRKRTEVAKNERVGEGEEKLEEEAEKRGSWKRRLKREEVIEKEVKEVPALPQSSTSLESETNECV